MFRRLLDRLYLHILSIVRLHGIQSMLRPLLRLRCPSHRHGILDPSFAWASQVIPLPAVRGDGGAPYNGKITWKMECLVEQVFFWEWIRWREGGM